MGVTGKFTRRSGIDVLSPVAGWGARLVRFLPRLGKSTKSTLTSFPARVVVGVSAVVVSVVVGFGVASVFQSPDRPRDVIAGEGVSFYVAVDAAFTPVEQVQLLVSGVPGGGSGMSGFDVAGIADELAAPVLSGVGERAGVDSTEEAPSGAWLWLGEQVAVVGVTADAASSGGVSYVIVTQSDDVDAARTWANVRGLSVETVGESLPWIAVGDAAAVSRVFAGPGIESLTQRHGDTFDAVGDQGSGVLVAEAWLNVEAASPERVPFIDRIPGLTDALFGPVGVRGEGEVAAAAWVDSGGITAALQSTTFPASEVPPGVTLADMWDAPADSSFTLTVLGAAPVAVQGWPVLTQENPFGFVERINEAGLSGPEIAALIGNSATLSYRTETNSDEDVWWWLTQSPDPVLATQAGTILVSTGLLGSASMGDLGAVRGTPDGRIVLANPSSEAALPITRWGDVAQARDLVADISDDDRGVWGLLARPVDFFPTFPADLGVAAVMDTQGTVKIRVGDLDQVDREVAERETVPQVAVMDVTPDLSSLSITPAPRPERAGDVDVDVVTLDALVEQVQGWQDRSQSWPQQLREQMNTHSEYVLNLVREYRSELQDPVEGVIPQVWVYVTNATSNHLDQYEAVAAGLADVEQLSRSNDPMVIQQAAYLSTALEGIALVDPLRPDLLGPAAEAFVAIRDSQSS